MNTNSVISISTNVLHLRDRVQLFLVNNNLNLRCRIRPIGSGYYWAGFFFTRTNETLSIYQEESVQEFIITMQYMNIKIPPYTIRQIGHSLCEVLWMVPIKTYQTRIRN